MKIEKVAVSLAVSLFFLMVLCVVSSLAASELEIVTLSTKPDMVSGDDVLVQINVPHTVPIQQVRVTLNGSDVTNAFVLHSYDNHRPPRGGGGTMLGLLHGLTEGPNTIMAYGPGKANGQLSIRNYPITGPIFSGPHQIPFVCTTVVNGLGEPIDPDCSALTKVEYFYRSTQTSSFKPLVDLNSRPADLAQTTTIDGEIVDYIVRVEGGTINRHVYRIAILYDPQKPFHDPWSADGRMRGREWNRKLLYYFGGGCGVQYFQGRSTDATVVLIDDALRLGYAVAHASNNRSGNNCNDVLSAETAMMVKEYFIENYGLPKYTVGLGGSGGAFQQRLIAHNYPSLLDGLTLQLPFPDVTTMDERGLDCSLLENYYASTASGPFTWTPEKQAAVNGYALSATGSNACKALHPTLGLYKINPTLGWDSLVPTYLRYDPVTNPGGARKTKWDNMVNIYGIDPVTGFARATFDNTGIQYGLKALNDGVISKEEFLDLNETIGGYDIDGNYVPQRSVGNLKGLQIEYETGRVVTGGSLRVPMIEVRRYLDTQANVHDRVWTFAMKERLIRDNGHADNLVAWTLDPSLTENAYVRLALLGMDEWLENLKASGSGAPYADKVVETKPHSLVDTCWNATGEKIEEPAVYSAPSECNSLFPPHLMPRMVAGGPLANDVMKCKLKTIDWGEYTVSFTPEEKIRLGQIFPQGVCDWSASGVGQKPFAGPWQSFGP